MTAILWFFSLIGCYAAFLLWRAKFTLRTLRDQNEQFRTANFEEIPRKKTKQRVQRYISSFLPTLDNQHFKSLVEFTNHSMGTNFHSVFLSNDGTTLCELNYMRVHPGLRLILLLTSPKAAFVSDTYCVCLETPYENGEVAITTTMVKSPLPRWIHAKWMPKETKLIELLLGHLQLRDTLESARSLKPRGIVDKADYFAKDSEHRKRLSRHLDLDFESLVRENNLEHLMNEK